MPATSVSSVPKQLKYEQEKLDDVQVNIQSSLSHNRSGICARVNCKRFHMQHQQRREITLILLFAVGCTTRVEKGLALVSFCERLQCITQEHDINKQGISVKSQHVAKQ